MNPLKKILSLSLGLVVLATVAVMISTSTVDALNPHVRIAAAPATPAIPVAVTNTPLPVSGNVNAAVSGTVNTNITNANVPVSGTVTVTGMPQVTLSGTSAVSLKNDEITPIYVETEANAAYFRQQASCFSANTASLSPYQNGQNDCDFNAFGFGVNYRLVVKSASVAVRAPLGTIVQNSYFGLSGGTGTFPLVFLPLTKMGSDASSDYYVGTAPILLYLDTTQSLACGFTSSPSPTTGASTPFSVQCTITGHLIPGIAD